MYLSILVAALIVFVLVMTMNKNIVEGLNCKNLSGKQKIRCRKIKRRWRSRWRSGKKSVAKNVFDSAKNELSKLEKEFNDLKNSKKDIDRENLGSKKKNARRLSQIAESIINDRDKSAVNVYDLGDIKVEADENNESASELLDVMKVSIDNAVKNKFDQRINKILNIENKNIIKKYIQEYRVSKVISKTKNLKQDIQDYLDRTESNMKKDMNEINKHTDKITYLYNKAANAAVAENATTSKK